MKDGIIFAHKSTQRGRLDLDYLDETSQRKATSQQSCGKKLKQFADYASKETMGQVHAGGFLHDLIRINPDRTSTAPAKLSNRERKKRISEAWFNHIRKFPSSTKNPVIQHRMVFSMSAEFHDELVNAGINPDRVLQSTLKKVMGKFSERFCPDDAIGYAYGIHHDTAHLHVHVALCPRTAKGNYIGCSTSRTKQSGNKNQMDYIRSCFEKENQRWTQILASPEKLKEHISKRLDSDKIFFAPKLNRSQLNQLRNHQAHEATRLQQLYQGIQNLEMAIATKRLHFSTQRNIRFVSRIMGHRSARPFPDVSALSKVLERRSLRQLQNLLFTAKKEYRALHQQYSRVYGFTSNAHRNPNTQTSRSPIKL